MQSIWLYTLRWKLWRDERGQDLIEYSLMLAFGAVAAGAFFPPFADGLTTIFSKLNSMLSDAS